jgi:hypothetical protein
MATKGAQQRDGNKGMVPIKWQLKANPLLPSFSLYEMYCMRYMLETLRISVPKDPKTKAQVILGNE